MAFSQSLFADSILNLPGDLPRQVMDELQRGFRVHEVLAAKEQMEIAAAQGENHTVDGLGQKVASITPYAYHYWGQRLGYSCWKDKKFRSEFLRDTPEARVRTVARKCALRVDGRKNAQRSTFNAERSSGNLVTVNRFGK